MDLSARATLDEEMDAPGLDEAVYRRCLRDLAALNRLTMTHRATLQWLERVTKGLPEGAGISVLDVAYGQGDLLRAIGHWAAKRGLQARLLGVDLNPRSRVAAMAATPADQKIAFCTGDVFDFVPGPVDFIVTSQFTHHLTGPEIVRLLGWLEAHAGRGWHIADLQRHWFAYYGFPLLARVMGWHRIVRQDGRISIARGFARAEWLELLAQAGIVAQVGWRFPFRHSISRLK